jgi:hypothetical protein
LVPPITVTVPRPAGVEIVIPGVVTIPEIGGVSVFEVELKTIAVAEPTATPVAVGAAGVVMVTDTVDGLETMVFGPVTV